jgi:hypothetical protein
MPDVDQYGRDKYMFATVMRIARTLTAGRRPWTTLFAVLIVVAILVRLWLVHRIRAPQLFCDEFIYADMAKSLARTGHPLFREEPARLNVLYPLLISPAWLGHSTVRAYGVAKAINVALMTSAAALVYVWARRLVSPLQALVAVVLALAMPAFVYTNLILSENAFMPAFVLAAFAIALALERPTLGRQIFAVAAMLLATAARTQGLVLIPLLALALALRIGFDLAALRGGRWTAARRQAAAFAPTAILVAAGALAYLVYNVAQGQPLTSGLGSYQSVVHAHYSVGPATRWTLYHFEELAVAVGAFPVTALVIMVAVALKRDRVTTDAERSLLAVAVPAVVLLPIEAGLFASRFGGHPFERYVMYAFPLLILVFVVWLAHGLPRPRIAGLVGIALPVAAVAAFPLLRFLGTSLYDSLTVGALTKASPHVHGAHALVWTVRIGAVLVTVAALLLPRRAAAMVLPGLLLAAWIVVAWPNQGFVEATGVALRGWAGSPPDWVDDAIGDRQAGYLYVAGSDGIDIATQRMLESEFWNKSVRVVYSTGEHELCDLSERTLAFDPATGRLEAAGGEADSRYLVSTPVFELDAKTVAQQAPLTVYRLSDHIRVKQVTEGVFSDGWAGADAAFDVYVSDKRTVTLRVSRLGWSHTVISSATVRAGSLKVGNDGSVSIGRLSDTAFTEVHKESNLVFRLRVPRPPFRVELHIYPAFSPVYVGQGSDPRGLGALVELRS